VLSHPYQLNLDVRLLEYLSHHFLGGGAEDHSDSLAGDVGEAVDVGGGVDELAAAVHKSHMTEIHLFLPRKCVSRGAALEVDRAVRDHGNILKVPAVASAEQHRKEDAGEGSSTRRLEFLAHQGMLSVGHGFFQVITVAGSWTSVPSSWKLIVCLTSVPDCDRRRPFCQPPGHVGGPAPRIDG
jgi:hypothetical protein